MDTTDCLGLPFPQCDPPLTKDASDIIQFQALAEAVDEAVENLDDQITDTLSEPPSVNMTGGVTTAGLDVLHFYGGATNFDNANMADTVADVIRIQQDGWYLIGGWVAADPGIAFRVEPIVNGDTISSRQGPGLTAGVSGDRVAWTDCAFLRTGDALQIMTHHTSSPVGMVTYGVVGWATLLLANE